MVLFQGNTTTNELFISLKVPFRYRDLTRPTQAGPFPSSISSTSTRPKTLFKATLHSRRRGDPDLEIHVSKPLMHPIIMQILTLTPFRCSCRLPEYVQLRSRYRFSLQCSEMKNLLNRSFHISLLRLHFILCRTAAYIICCHPCKSLVYQVFRRN